MSNSDLVLDYGWLTQDALRQVVRHVLGVTAELGMTPGDHHFYIEFMTTAPGVRLASHLRDQYPERMTIVLQHQFDDLEVGADAFEVTLRFRGVADRLHIPFAAITRFSDPPAEFALQFAPPEPAAAPAAGPTEGAGLAEVAAFDAHRPRVARQAEATDGDDPETPPPGGSADIVSIDRFRKK